jgi:hypothetical protein
VSCRRLAGELGILAFLVPSLGFSGLGFWLVVIGFALLAVATVVEGL